jgi:hypothetical protein
MHVVPPQAGRPQEGTLVHRRQIVGSPAVAAVQLGDSTA